MCTWSLWRRLQWRRCRWPSLCPNDCSARQGQGSCDRTARRRVCAAGWGGRACDCKQSARRLFGPWDVHHAEPHVHCHEGWSGHDCSTRTRVRGTPYPSPPHPLRSPSPSIRRPPYLTALPSGAVPARLRSAWHLRRRPELCAIRDMVATRATLSSRARDRSGHGRCDGVKCLCDDGTSEMIAPCTRRRKGRRG